MGLPRKFKDGQLFNNGNRYLGEWASVTLPKLTRKLEDWRGGGMDSAVKIDMGGDAMEMEWSLGGPMKDVLSQYGETDIAGVQLRFAGAWQQDDTGDVDRIEVVIRGRHEEIDMGEIKPGEGGEFKVKTALSYYKLTWNGETLIEADPLNGVLIVGGVDRRAAIRNALNS
ncbi:phage major tail tube protein [Sphingomonas sp. Leaf242]|uniref:phage major tail tube protein n=1 Tax=Sphingomonas sp. Leaf242 TaxID=1736304 RepID=UPI0007145100|nr:phage major tail tube protein [Sphingomonas sp. Leaf242]KQO07865.1 phage tail protein [Sphingomonas sp. Leaf242]